MDALHRLVTETAARATRKNQARLGRLLGMLDLDPRVAPEAILKAVDEELGDQKARGRAALAGLEAKDERTRNAIAALHAVLDGEGLDRGRLEAALQGAPEAVRACGQALVDRHARFEKRLGWLLRPTPEAELAALDPVADRNQLYHAISWHFRLEQKLFSMLFEVRAGTAAFAAIQFHSTGEYSYRGFRRNNETFLIFSNLIEWGLDSKRGREMMARLNGIHGRYAAANAGFLYTIGGIMFVPEEWNRRIGWRRFSDHERLGWFHTFAELGRAMGIEGITDDYDEMYRTWVAISEDHCGSSHVGQKLFSEVITQIYATYPVEVRKPLLWALIAGMDDIFREMIGLPTPPPEVVDEVRAGLRFVGRAGSLTSPVPWIRSLQLHPLYESVSDLGVGQRAKYLPLIAGDTRPAEERLAANGGYATDLPPISRLDQVPEPALPTVDMAEVARHASDDDAWLVIDGIVYDVTRFLFEHPGGRKVLAPHLGRDATDTFRQVPHTAGAHVLMLNFRVARVSDAPTPTVPAPPLKERFPRRLGKNRVYSAAEFHGFVETALGWMQDYEKALQKPGRNPDEFPIVLPWDLRLQKERGVGVDNPLHGLGRTEKTEVLP